MENKDNLQRERRFLNKDVLISSPYILWSILFIIVPLLIIFIYSIDNLDANGNFTWDFTLDSYRKFFNPFYFNVFLKSVKISCIATVVCLVLGYPVAYIIAQMDMKIRDFLIMFIILPQWTNFLIRTYAWMAIIKDNGPINNFLIKLGLISNPIPILYTDTAILMGMVYNFLPYMILPIYTIILKIDKLYIEAAYDLGASKFTTFRKVILPLSLPGVISGFIMVFMPAISTFVISDLLGGGKSMLIGNLIQNQFLAARNWQFGSSISMILIIIIIITMLVLNKYNQKGSKGGIF